MWVWPMLQTQLCVVQVKRTGARATEVVVDQERRARRGLVYRCRVSLMFMICFRCFRIRSHVSDSREFQSDPSLAEGSLVHDCTLATADDGIEPPAIMCEHGSRSIRELVAFEVGAEPYALENIINEQ
ncbi:hypothetical protein M3J09_008377 [Ascochyta lentis]